VVQAQPIADSDVAGRDRRAQVARELADELREVSGCRERRDGVWFVDLLRETGPAMLTAAAA
jgi:hypothetical protein